MSSHWTLSRRKVTGRFPFYLRELSSSSASSATRTLLPLRLMYTTGEIGYILRPPLTDWLLRDMHGDTTTDRLTCPDCGKLFTSKRSLVGHKKEKHSGTLEIFPCQHCGKNFSRKSNLKAHMDSIHFGKKFPCSYCERIFTNRSCMNLHVKKIHSETLYNLW